MIKAIITDFDGTLVDTFDANFRAYQDAFRSINMHLSEEKYRECFGYRFDNFMLAMNINDDKAREIVKDIKMQCYPKYFNFLKLNKTLIEIVETFRQLGGKTAIASTARKENLMNVVNALNLEPLFDSVLSGVDVKNGKPNPEIYIKAMKSLGVQPSETIIFEDSAIGIDAAKASGAKCIKVDESWFQ